MNGRPNNNSKVACNAARVRDERFWHYAIDPAAASCCSHTHICPNTQVKVQYMPRHVFIGIFTYFAAAFTCLLGIQDKNSALGCTLDYTLTEPEYDEAAHYWDLYSGCRVSNGLGIVIIVTCLCATYAVMNTRQVGADQSGLARPLL